MLERTLSATDLHSVLAHRHPFLLVDTVEILSPGRHVVGRKIVSATESWASGRPAAAMPFVLVLEALAQTTGALIKDLTDGAAGAIAYFMAADRVRFRQPAIAGDELTLDVTLRQWRRGVCRTSGSVRLQSGLVVMTAELTTIVRAVG